MASDICLQTVVHVFLDAMVENLMILLTFLNDTTLSPVCWRCIGPMYGSHCENENKFTLPTNNSHCENQIEAFAKKQL